MSHIRRVLAGLGAALLLVLGVGFAPASADQMSVGAGSTEMAATSFVLVSAEQASDVEKSIVLVGIGWTGSVQFPDDGKWYNAKTGYLCTGWFATGKGDIVTAEHCVAESGQVERDLVDNFLTSAFDPGTFTEAEIAAAKKTWPVDGLKRTVRVVQPSHVKGATITQAREVDVIATDTDGDHALLKLNGYDNTPALKIASKSATLQEKVTSYGFAGDVGSMTDPDSESVTVTSGSVSSVEKRREGTPFTGVDISMGSGMSGGPTLNTQNAVLGVNSYGSDAGSADFNFITDHGYLTNFLTRNGVKFTSGGTGTSEAGESARPGNLPRTAEGSGDEGWPQWLIVLIIGVVVLAIGAGIAFAVIRQRNRPTQPAMAPPAQPDYGQTMTMTVPPTRVCVNDSSHPIIDSGAEFCGRCGGQVVTRPTTGA